MCVCVDVDDSGEEEGEEEVEEEFDEDGDAYQVEYVEVGYD